MTGHEINSKKSRLFCLAPWLPGEAVLVAQYHQKQMERHAYTDEALDRFQRLFCRDHEREVQQQALWAKLDRMPWRTRLYDTAKLSFDLPAHWTYVKPYDLQYPPKKRGRTRPEKVISQVVITTEKLKGLIDSHPFLFDFFNFHSKHGDLRDRLDAFAEDIAEWDPSLNYRSTNNEVFEGSSRFKTTTTAPQIKYFCREMYLLFFGTYKRPAYGIIADIANLLFDTNYEGDNIKKMTSDLRDRPSLVQK